MLLNADLIPIFQKGRDSERQTETCRGGVSESLGLAKITLISHTGGGVGG